MENGKIMKIWAVMLIGLFGFSSFAFADVTLIDNLNLNGTGTTNMSLYQDGDMLYNQQEYANGTLNRTRYLYLNTSDEDLRKYVEEHAGYWEDNGDVNSYSVSNIIEQSVGYLKGESYDMPVAVEIGNALDGYFASDKDVQQLLKMIDDLYMKANNLNLRLSAVENTLEAIASEDYCNAKLEIAQKYNITLKGLKCGLNSTYYYTVDKEDGTKGLLAIETVDPYVDPTPIKMFLIGPKIVFEETPFKMGVVLNNTGSRFGAFKIELSLPDGWKASDLTYSGTIGDKETKVIYFSILPNKNSGSINVNAKIVLSGRTYKLNSQTGIISVQPIPSVEQPKEEGHTVPTFFITANIINNDNLSRLTQSVNGLLTTSAEAITNLSLFLDEITNNNSAPQEESSAPPIPITTSTIDPLAGLKTSIGDYISYVTTTLG